MGKLFTWISRAEVRFAAACSLLLSVLVFMSMFSGAHPGAIDYGEYDTVLSAAGLVRTQWDLEHSEERYYVKPIERFEYARFSYAKLLIHPVTPTIVYPITLVRLATRPFGLGFSTIYLFCLYVLILTLSAFQILRYCFVRMRMSALVPAALMMIVFTNRSLLGYLNSLYAPGMAITMCMAYIACVTRAALRGGRAAGVVSALVGFLLVGAQPELIALLPAVLVTSAAIMVRNRNGRAGYALICVAVLLLGSLSSIAQFRTTIDLSSNASSYHATFLGLLKYSPDAEADLNRLGLDDSYLADVGLSYYEPDDVYAHNPHNAEEAAALFARIGPTQRAAFYFHQPARMVSVLEGMNADLTGYDSARVVSSTGLSAVLIDMLIPDGLTVSFVALIIVMVGALVIWIVRVRHGGSVLALFWFAWALGAFAYPVLCAYLRGDASVDLARGTYTFFTHCSLAVVATVLALAIYRWYDWTEERPWPAAPTYEPMPTSPIARGLSAMADSRRMTAAAVLVVGVIMAAYLLFMPPRAGSVNNGDFGRMMDQLDLFWTDDVAADGSLQAGRNVIETYTFRRPFDPLKLTAFNPVSSLIYPAMLVRLFCEATGQLFHTNYLSFLFAAITLLCLWRLAMDLHLHYGRWTLAMGLTLTAMLLGEVYFVWFNSLFGEGSIYLGLIMTLTCSVWLAGLPRGKGARGVFLLGFAVRFLVTAKAQMAVALPLGVALIAAFAIYHRPMRKGRALTYGVLVLAMCTLISVATIGVYRDNDRLSSRYTVWQSVFYGLLMNTDDPDAAMDELGIDPRMAPDIGKHAYLPDEEYVYSPTSEEAQIGFYDHVNTFTVIWYYLRHPGQLIQMLDRAASQSVTLHDGFMAYVGQRYDQVHDPVNRLGIWQFLRPWLACRAAWQYGALYLAAGVWWLRRALRRGADGRSRMMALTMLMILGIGVLQFPLTVIGNGFADNNKQLFGFMLCHDILMIVLGYEVLSRALCRLAARRKGKPAGSSNAIIDGA